ncbi:MAG: carbohydrate kinase family protein [Anaerolineales bacterium]
MSVRYLIIGGLREDYCITHDGQARSGVLGGNAVYAATGAALWSDSVGLLGRVGSNFPTEWIEQIAESGLDTTGIKVLSDPHDTRTFYAYLSLEERVDTDPNLHYQRAGIPVPKALADYVSSTEGQRSKDRFGPLALRPEDLPSASGMAAAAHLAPGDYLTHSIVPARLRELGVGTVMVDPSARYMEPEFRKELPDLLKGLAAFLPSESEATSYFQPRPPDLWEMAESLSELGCPIVGIKRGGAGVYLWDQVSRRRLHIPAYPSRVVDVTGAGDAFCGGFLVGLNETDDVLEAGLRGSVSASLAIEGAGALYAMGAAPGLPQARLEALRPMARLI